MKKIFSLLLSIALLFGCAPKVTSFPNTPFENGTYIIQANKNESFEKMYIENGQLFISFNANKSLPTLFSEFSFNRFMFDKLPEYDENSTQPDVRWYRNGIKGYNSRYGHDYLAFIGATITKVQGQSNTWVVRIDGKDALYLEVKADNTFSDQYGNIYKKQ